MAPPCGSGRRWMRAVKLTLLLFFLVPMSSVGIRNTNTIFDKKKKLEIQRQLKRLNKPALKTIKSPDGDIIDCVDIKKQPAFDHPLLKNHTIQMRPGSYPEEFLFKESNNVSSNSKPKITQSWHLNGRCPEGTIPIRRTKEEDLLRASSVANYGRQKYNSIPNDDNNAIHEYATLIEEGDTYYGMNADINVWNPHVQEQNEFSLAQFWLAAADNNGVNRDTIEGGVMVYHEMNQDYRTRLFTFWTNNGYQSGCYNLLCPGFVQTDNRLAFGASLEPYSDYGGDQSSVNFFVFKDNVDGHWWLQLGDNFIMGYWPSSLFSILANSATSVTWGGEVINEQRGGQHTTTQMGSGHFAEEGPKRASFFQNLKVIDHEVVLRGPRDNRRIVTHPNCYNLLKGDDFFYYGGPGRSPICP
uniref:Neprosin PEP catalytic domain-containing protein n=1 Tax=Quercus lobata TaxID=97700 RepID=A0A7N2LBT6_QUELO